MKAQLTRYRVFPRNPEDRRDLDIVVPYRIRAYGATADIVAAVQTHADGYHDYLIRFVSGNNGYFSPNVGIYGYSFLSLTDETTWCSDDNIQEYIGEVTKCLMSG